MRKNLSSDKCQLLSIFFEGNADKIKQYKVNQQWVDTPYRWIINDTVAGTLYGIGKDESQYLIRPNDLAKASPNIVFQIVDFSGGKRIPGIDEDYQQ